MSKFLSVFTNFLLLCSLANYAQQTNTNELGTPFIQNFGPRDYYAGKVAFGSIFQDKKGFMFFNSDYSTLHFDGVNWNTFFAKKKFEIKKIIQDKNDVLYFITPNTFGKFEVQENNWPYQKDLSFKIPKKIPPIKKMINCYSVNDKVYFISNTHVFILIDDTFSILSPNSEISRSFLHNNKIHLILKEEVVVIENENLKPIKSKGLFLKNDLVDVIADTDSNQLIIVTEKGEFFSLKNIITKPLFSLPPGYQINSKTDHPVILLPDNEFAISIKDQGILHCDQYGNIIQIINDKNGIPSSNITSMLLDSSSGLWVSHPKGISRIDISSNITLFDPEKLGWGRISDVQRFQNQMYFGTTKGVFIIRKDSTLYDISKKIKRISAHDLEVFDLNIIQKDLLAATNQGVFKIANNKLISLSNQSFKTLTLKKSQIGNWAYAGTDYGLRILKKNQKGIWNISNEKYIDNATTLHIEEGNDNDIWLNNSNPGYIRIKIKYDPQKRPIIDSSFAKTYLPFSENNSGTIEKVFKIKNKLLFNDSSNDPLEYDQTQNKLIPYQLFDKNFFTDTYKGMQFGIREIFLHKDKAYAVTALMPHLILKGAYNDSLKQVSITKNVYSKIKTRKYFQNFFFDIDDVIWLNDMKLFRIDERKTSNTSPKFKTHISQVLVDNDSTISHLFNKQKIAKLPDTMRTIKFKFGAPTYHEVNNTKFKFYLEGYDKGFQTYFDYDNQKKYDNLRSGTYTFHVIAKNQEQVVGEEATFTFTILPPWYQTKWAYLFYTLLLGIFIWIIVKWRTRQIHKKNIALELTITERTEELAEKNERLKHMDETKSRFFANISHEFRTPLTLILGPLENKLKSNDQDQDHMLMHRNAKRLQELINQLLEISKLESGEMNLKIIEGDVASFIKMLASSFTSLADVKNIDFQCEIEPSGQSYWFDPDKLEKIVNNLISNTFKFTPENKSISINSSFSKNKPGYLKLIIKDTGIGISQDKLPYLFERFYQVDTSETREQEGSGIGLALVKELMNLYGGKIEVTSKLGIGTTFTVILPVEKSFFNSKDLSKDPVKQTETVTKTISIEQPINKSTAVDNKENTILIVEDNDDLRNYIKTSINTAYQIIEAKDGLEGIELALKYIPDLIITDIMMPKLNGEQLCQTLKTDTKTCHIPIIMLTAKADLKSQIKGFKIGADAYIPKPFQIEELDSRIENLISTREKLKKHYQKNIIISPSAITAKSQDEKFLIKLSTYIEENITKSDLNVESIMEVIGLSRTQLHRKLKALTGLSTTEFIRTIKLKRAAQLLDQNSDTVTQIGYSVGFSDHSYFSKCFKKQYGITPSEYNSKNR